MATTESLMNSSLTAQTDADNMEVGTSPYPLVDDIEVDFEDDDAQYAEDNSMVDDAPASLDPMQGDVDVAQPDDHMDDEEITYEDYEMSAAENHDDAVYYDETAEIHQDTSIHEVDSHEFENYHDQNDVLEASTEDVYESELVDEEDTNTKQYSSPQLDLNKNGNAEYEEPNGHTQRQNNLDIIEASHDVLETTPMPQEHDHLTNSEAPITATRSEEVDEADEADAANGDAVEKSVLHDQSKLLTENPEPKHSQVPLETAPGDVHVHPRSPSPAEIHPVTVDYNGTIYSLFPCRDEGLVGEILLEDPALALLPINSLLKELHTPVADYLGHEDEIVLDIPSLGLHICEDSKYAVELTLSQVIDTYMMLSQNQALGHIEPLHCQLSHRTCLRTQMQYLVDSARGGKTYAEIVEEHLGSPDKEGHPHGEDTFDDFATAEDDADHDADDAFDNNDQAAPTLNDQASHVSSGDDNTAEVFGGDEYPEVEQADSHTEQDDAEDPEEQEGPQQLRNLDEHTNGFDLDQEHSADTSYQVADHDHKDIPETEDLNAPSDQSEEEEAEDLFADGAFNEEPTSAVEIAKEEEQAAAPEENLPPFDATQSPHVDDDELDFDLWEKEDQLQAENGNQIAPVTPSKSSTSKRKVDEDEDELDLEFTPQPKKSRSS